MATDLDTPTMTKRQAWDLVGGLSSPSKMPGHGYSVPARACAVGARLRDQPGSVCANCYALKGNYRFDNVQAALERRLRSLTDPRWADAMVLLIERTGDTHFRWHDSGDLQGVWHLELIAQVAARTPQVAHWLPTRERRIIRDFEALGQVLPPNLTVRLSAHMVDAPPPSREMPTSTVVRTPSSAAEVGHRCPARSQGNRCGDCRACWDPDVANVVYQDH